MGINGATRRKKKRAVARVHGQRGSVSVSVSISRRKQEVEDGRRSLAKHRRDEQKVREREERRIQQDRAGYLGDFRRNKTVEKGIKHQKPCSNWKRRSETPHMASTSP